MCMKNKFITKFVSKKPQKNVDCGFFQILNFFSGFEKLFFLFLRNGRVFQCLLELGLKIGSKSLPDKLKFFFWIRKGINL